jgi:hypothetical protein
MALEKTLSMEPVKAKLKNLREHMPDQEDVVYDFASYLADRLNSELVPEGFYMASQLVLYDLQKGVSGFPSNPIPSSLAGYPPQMYAFLNMYVSQIADAVCPPEFAEGVKRMDDAVHKK